LKMEDLVLFTTNYDYSLFDDNTTFLNPEKIFHHKEYNQTYFTEKEEENFRNQNQSLINSGENDDNNKNYEETESITKKEKEKEKENTNDNKTVIKKKRGRPGTTGEHNKFSDDNLRRKVKHILIDQLLSFINSQIYKIYKGQIGNGVFVKKLLTLNQRQKTDSTIQFNKEFLTKNLGEIFSDDISSKFTIFPLDHNRNTIINFLNEEDEEKRQYFTKLFSLTFLDCLEHFRGSKIINELKGLKGIESIKLDDEEYLKQLKYYFNNYEQIIYKKRTRNKKMMKYQIN